WNISNDNKWYSCVNLSGNKQVQVYKYNDGEFDYLQKWTENFKNDINGFKKSNKFLIQKRRNIAKIFINGKLVHQTGLYGTYRTKLGIIVNAGMEIEIDDLKVTEYPLAEIKVVSTFDPNLKMEKLPETINISGIFE